MRICDTGGIEENAGLHHSYFKGARGLVLIVRKEAEGDDIMEQCEQLTSTVEEFHNRNEDVAVVIGLNECEDTEGDEAAAVKDNLPEEYHEWILTVNASDGDSTNELFNNLIGRINAEEFVKREGADE